jgi:hypothetical protein
MTNTSRALTIEERWQALEQDWERAERQFQSRCRLLMLQEERLEEAMERAAAGIAIIDPDQFPGQCGEEYPGQLPPSSLQSEGAAILQEQQAGNILSSRRRAWDLGV